jgi:hypothetical protein
VDASARLAEAEDCVIDEAVAILAQRDEARQSPGPEERRRDVRQLFHLVLRCMRAGRAEPIIMPSERIAAHCYASARAAERHHRGGKGCDGRIYVALATGDRNGQDEQSPGSHPPPAPGPRAVSAMSS